MSDDFKVLLPIERDDGTVEIESVWATQVHRAASGWATFPSSLAATHSTTSCWATDDGDGLCLARGLLEASGHSTIRLLFARTQDIQPTRDTLRAEGCGSELWAPSPVAVDVPPDVPYAKLREYLEQNEQAGVFEYEEGCLGQPT